MDEKQISYTEAIFSDPNTNFDFTIIEDDDDDVTVYDHSLLIWKGVSPATGIKFITLSTKTICLRV